mgnify:FL=1
MASRDLNTVHNSIVFVQVIGIGNAKATIGVSKTMSIDGEGRQLRQT